MMSSPIRGTGHIPDPEGDYRPASDIVGSAMPAPRWSDGVRPYCPTPIDQLSDESCVGETIDNAIYARQGVEGKPQRRSSSRAIWYFARKLSGTQTRNVGCRPIDAFYAIDDLGYPTEDEWPRSQPLDLQPDGKAMRYAQDRESIVSGRIASVGYDREEELKTTVNAGFPTCIALKIDQSYQENADGIWVPGGAERGWHYSAMVSYDQDGAWTLGSYGLYWGLAGYIHVPWSVIRNPKMCSDIWALRFSGSEA